MKLRYKIKKIGLLLFISLTFYGCKSRSDIVSYNNMDIDSIHVYDYKNNNFILTQEFDSVLINEIFSEVKKNVKNKSNGEYNLKISLGFVKMYFHFKNGNTQEIMVIRTQKYGLVMLYEEKRYLDNSFNDLFLKIQKKYTFFEW